MRVSWGIGGEVVAVYIGRKELSCRKMARGAREAVEGFEGQSRQGRRWGEVD